MQQTMWERIHLLIGEAALKRLHQACVMVVGIGGVGGYAAEALARSGIGRLILVDADQVAASNLNRQIIATHQTLGMNKTDAMRQRIAEFAPQCEVVSIPRFFDAQSDALFAMRPDYVVDAIDTLTCKMDLIAMAAAHGVPSISSLGMANRLDPSCLQVTTLDKTSGDPLARALRQLARRRQMDLKAIPVVWSSELPRRQNQVVDAEAAIRKQRIPPASVIFVPAAAGLLCASVVFRALIERADGQI